MVWLHRMGAGIFLFKEQGRIFPVMYRTFYRNDHFPGHFHGYPNGHYLRPATFAHNNIFVHLVKWLYATDTATNLFPSIHVYNSIAVNMAVWHCDNFKNKKVIRYGSAILMVSIILSTMFLKQHSVFDVVTGILLAIFIYTLVYANNPVFTFSNVNKYERKLHRV